MSRLLFQGKTGENSIQGESYGKGLGSLEEGIFVDRHKQVIGVIGIGSGAGATFIAMSLAFEMAEKISGVTFAEGKAHGSEAVSPYRLLAVDRSFRKKRFTDFFTEDSRERPRDIGSRVNLYKNVNWAVRKPVEPHEGAGSQAGSDNRAVSSDWTDSSCRAGGTDWTGSSCLENRDFAACRGSAAGPDRLDYRRLAGNRIIVDNPASAADMDIIVAVVDPLPSRIVSGLETFRLVKKISDDIPAAGTEVIWLLNKAGSAVSRRETERFLKQKFDLEQMMIPQEIFYKAEYSCTQSYYLCRPQAVKKLAKILTAKF